MRRALLLSLLLPLAAFAIDTTEFDDPATEARYRALISELRCLVCQNQTLADSNAPLAVDLREQVRLRVARGDSNDEIIAYLTERYGDFVLYRPRVTATTIALWAAPFVFLALGGAIAWRVLRTPAGRAVVDDARRERVRRLLDEDTR